jgi:hypothetical protein
MDPAITAFLKFIFNIKELLTPEPKLSKRNEGGHFMNEGLFWVICTMSENSIDWNEDWELYTIFVQSNSISHEVAWNEIAKKSLKWKIFCDTTITIIIRVDVWLYEIIKQQYS